MNTIRAQAVEAGFSVLDAALLLRGPEQLVGPLRTVYSRFLVPPESLVDPLRITVEPGAEESLQIGDRTYRFVAGLDPVQQLYQQFLLALMCRISSHAVLHAAALATPDGGCLLLAGPSGYGKSSLTLELVRRGLGFLSDDYAPLDLSQRTVKPYPRPVGIVAGGTAPLPEPLRIAAQNPAAERFFGKILLDLGEVLGEEVLIRKALPLRKVVLLSGDAANAADQTQTTLLKVVARSEAADRIQQELTGIAGVDILESGDLPAVRYWRLRMQHDTYPTPALTALLNHDSVLHTEKYWTARPDFTTKPARLPLKRRETAEYLGRELLNRRETSRLLDRYQGKVASLFLDLAGALSAAECWRLTVGRFAETADLLEQIARSPS